MLLSTMLCLWSWNVWTIQCKNDEFTSTDFMHPYPLTSDDISHIVDAHNTFRRLEPATNMNLVAWNVELASLASNWTRMCSFSHRPQSSRLHKGHVAGETIFGLIDSGLQKPDWLKVVLRWYDEKFCFNMSTGHCNESSCTAKQCGHYVQLVRNDTTLIGCALSRCSQIGNGNAEGLIFVCNYDTFANWQISEEGKLPVPYTPANAKYSVCSQCPFTLPQCHLGLCSNCSQQTCKNSTGQFITSNVFKFTVTDKMNGYTSNVERNVKMRTPGQMIKNRSNIIGTTRKPMKSKNDINCCSTFKCVKSATFTGLFIYFYGMY